jgi:predicted RNase H-like HicB family nuclease
LDGLAAAGKSREEVIQEARWAAETLLDLANVSSAPELSFTDAKFIDE